MSKQAEMDRVEAIVKAAEALSQAKAEFLEASARIKDARAEYKKCIDNVNAAESADYENLYTQE